jgi:two-component system cell cycle response regulator DivK
VGQKILVVEDNELNLKLFCDLLRAHGYAAEPVRDGRDAVARARAFAPDLIVMDIQMPHITGLELIEQMKGDLELRPTPIMAVTAYAAKGDEERIREAGAEGYVSKPISVMKFVEAVRTLLAAPRRGPEPAMEQTGQAEESDVEEVPLPESQFSNGGHEEKPVKRANDGGPSLYDLFAWAIENQVRILCRYKDLPREVSPVVLGRKDGKEMARVYQTGGESSGDLPDWRTFELSNVSDVRLVANGWRTGPAGQQDQSPFEVDYDANPDGPFNPTRNLGDLRGAPIDYPIEGR